MKTIRAKMIVLMVSLCGFIIMLILLLSIGMFEPAYYKMIGNELNNVVTVVEQTLETSGLDGEQWEKQRDKLETAGICIEVVSPTLSTQFVYYEGIGDSCGIHYDGTADIFGQAHFEINTETAVHLRSQAWLNGSVAEIVANNIGGQQYVVGRYIKSQDMIIMASTNLERVEQALMVFRKQLFGITFMVMGAAIIAAIVTSKWITRPIKQISIATREMANGNYDVSVEATSDDELGALAKDFNSMAKEVNKTDKLQKELVANFSHDLRTPLTLIKGYAETVRDLTGDNKKLRDEQLEVIVDETDRLSNLVSNAMEFSKYTAGVTQLNWQQFDLNELVQDTAMRYNRLYEKSNYHVDTALCAEAVVKADPAMIERALDNLMVNAIAHIGADNTVILRTEKVKQGIRVTVEDHGTGIAQDELGHLFDRYYRARTSEGKEGTGLGLSIVKAIFTSHGFPFGVESELGKGSEFWFIINTELKSE